MVFASFVPTSFAIIFLATKDMSKSYNDESGITGGFAGFVCILFALAHTVAVSTKGASHEKHNIITYFVCLPYHHIYIYIYIYIYMNIFKYTFLIKSLSGQHCFFA